MSKLQIIYQKFVPFPVDVVLSQYYDYEHIEHVHPKTLGRYELLEQNGDFASYKQLWPRTLFSQPTSTVEHHFTAPNKMLFEFVEGRYKGTRVHTVLIESSGGTLVDETYEMNLPHWNWLGKIVKPFVVKRVDHIWAEDTDVDVCRDGWPGVPESAHVEKVNESKNVANPSPSDRLVVSDVAEGASCVFTVGTFEIAVFNVSGELLAIENRCPHTGGPLVLGTESQGIVVCPWHGAQFNLRSGDVVCGPSNDPVRTFPVREVNGEMIVELGIKPL